MEGPPLQPRPSHLKPAEEELPPPPEDPVSFPEREASTGMTGRSLCGPLGPRGASMDLREQLGEQGPTHSTVMGLIVVRQFYFYCLNLFFLYN